ncbi:hypothetical protein T09_13321 [Trichinella sp. T9]|nr:hypothetical protein T09_13321 [Trichinella sp. T9]
MHTVGPGIWRGKQKKVENFAMSADLEYGEKTENHRE